MFDVGVLNAIKIRQKFYKNMDDYARKLAMLVLKKHNVGEPNQFTENVSNLKKLLSTMKPLGLPSERDNQK